MVSYFGTYYIMVNYSRSPIMIVFPLSQFHTLINFIEEGSVLLYTAGSITWECPWSAITISGCIRKLFSYQH